MSHRAQTLSLVTTNPAEVLGAVLRLNGGASGGLLFLSGALTRSAAALAEQLARRSIQPWLIACGAGVMTELGEPETDSAAAAMTFRDARLHLVHERGDANFAEAVVDELSRRPGATALLFLRSDRHDDGWVDELNRKVRGQAILGAGTLPGIDLFTSDGSAVRSGAAVATIIDRSAVGRIGSSSACRLLSPLRPITRCLGPMVHEIEGASALHRLNEATAQLREHPLVLLAIAGESSPLSPLGRKLALRAIHGVDPSKGALMLGEEIPRGTQVAFAVRDARSARSDLEAQLKSMRTSCAGTAPEFGIYFCCAGRGVGLYGTGNVDVRLIRQNFPKMSLIGLNSTFELAPLDDRVVSQIYSGVLGVFCRPS